MALLLAGPAHGQKRDPSEVARSRVAQLIVKEAGTGSAATDIRHAEIGTAEDQARVQQWSAAAMQPLATVRWMSDGARVLRLATPMSGPDAEALAARLGATGAFEYVDVDYVIGALGTGPNDPYFPQQWNLAAPDIARGGANVAAAWRRAAAGAPVTVAVIDTGITAHDDLDGRRMGAGFDFLSANTLSTTADPRTGRLLPTGFVKNDGIAQRDADPSDPGDWVGQAEAANYPVLCGPAHPSSWHGTYVAGLISAVSDNAVGIAGISPTARVVNARVLGRCGGVTSDLIDALRWAGGVTVAGVPQNVEPAKVINLSLGSFNPCGPALQAAIDDVRARGVVVVAATGNDAATAAGAPANCRGVIGVTASTAEGDSAEYANIGPGTLISAPGGGRGTLLTGSQASVTSTMNLGAQAPMAPGFSTKTGTSVAAPHVSGVAALLLSMNTMLTPDDVAALLTQSARPFPGGTWCQAHAGLCGAGLLDADSALALLAGQPVVHATADADATSPVPPGTRVALHAKGAPGFGISGMSVTWSQASGPAVPLTPASANDSDMVVVPTAAGAYRFVVTLRNGAGSLSTDEVEVTVADTTPASAGGGTSGTTPATGPGGAGGTNGPPAPGATDASGNPGGSGGGGGAVNPVVALALLCLGLASSLAQRRRR